MPTIDRKKLAIIALAIVAAAVDQIAGTNFLGQVLPSLMGM